MNSFLARLKRVQTFLVSVILQKLVVPLLLTLTYFLIFGPMSALLRIFGKKQLRNHRIGQTSYWIEARGYDPDPGQSLQQS